MLVVRNYVIWWVTAYKMSCKMVLIWVGDIRANTYKLIVKNGL